jgi:hypothetical protein
MTTRTVDPHAFFESARCYSQRTDLSREIEWQRHADPNYFSEQDLLRETAWVVLCSGFRESVIRRVFDHISLCFFDWESADQVHQHRSTCIRAALCSLNNERKLLAIADCASIIAKTGFNRLKQSILADPLAQLQMFPFIGSITVWHLAKNLGMNVAKPDRHLVRLARACGFATAMDLCSHLAARHGEPVKVVDLILWRYLADHPRSLPASLTQIPKSGNQPTFPKEFPPEIHPTR